MRFKLLRGLHSQREPHPDGKDCLKCDGKGRVDHWRGGEKPCTVCLGTGKEHHSKEYSAKNPSLNVVSSEIDLQARFGSEKFQNIDSYTPNNDDLQQRVEQLQRENKKLKQQQQAAAAASLASLETEEAEPYTEEDLAGMTVKELRDLAEDNGIDLEKGSNKEHIIQTIAYAFQSA